MKQKTLLIFFVIFILLILGVFLPSLQKKVTQATPSLFDLSKYTKDSTNSITFTTADTELSLVKDGSSWKSGNNTISQQKIDEFFTSLKTVTDSVVVSSNEINFPQYGIATSSSVVVQLKNNDMQFVFEVGKPGPGGNSFYTRTENGKQVYLLTGDLLMHISAQENDWREKRIVELTSTEITNVNVQGLENFSLQKKEEMWEHKVGEQTKMLPSDDINPLISSLANLTASGFYSEEEKKLLETSKNPTTVMIQSTTGDQIQITIYKDDTNYLVLKNNQTDIYKVPGYSLTNFLQLGK